MPTPAMRVASAPVSFGVDEIMTDDAWMPAPDDMLDWMVDIGFEGTELGMPGFLGDAVFLGPMIRALAARWPEARIAACVTPRSVDVARRLGSRAMRADAIESMTCGWLSLVVVVGLVANLVLGAWWIDAVTSVGIVWFVMKEAREAWSGEDCCDHE